MGKIVFVGLGLFDEASMSFQALNACKDADILLLEQYTSRLTPKAVKKLEDMIGKSIRMLDRQEVEKGEFLSRLKDKTVAFMVPGDPMSATTHVDLRIRADELGFETEIIHGTSALTAVPGLLGLQIYRFGRTITIPFPQKGFDPTSPLEQMLENLERGLHTLALLDIQTSEKRYMAPNEGLKWLLSTSKKIGSTDRINDDTLACVVSRAGSKSCIARADRIAALLEIDFGDPLHTIVIPGKLHFEEAEALVRFAKAPRKLLSGG